MPILLISSILASKSLRRLTSAQHQWSFPLTHQSQSIVLIKTHLDCVTEALFFLCPSVSYLPPKHYITVTKFSAMSFQHLNLLHILITNWVTYKLRASLFLDLASSFILPVIFVSLECIRPLTHLFTSQVSTSDLLRTSFLLTNPNSSFPNGINQPLYPDEAFL